jgi:AcrR family transcriptional regulator
MVEKRQRLTQLERRTIAERRLLEAGVSLVAERGLDKISMADVGVAAGYSRGLPAQHFGTKANFQKALVHFITLEYRGYIQERAVNPGLDSLMRLLEIGFDTSRQDTMVLSIIYIVMSDAARDPVFALDLKGLRNATLDLIELHIRAGIRKGEIRKTVDSKQLSMILLVSVCGLIEEWLIDRTLDLGAAGSELIALLSRGLAPPVAAKKAKATGGTAPRAGALSPSTAG